MKMPKIGLGTWNLRGSECEGVVENAIGLGYRHIDTAQMYGNEKEVGKAIKNFKKFLLQRDIYIIPKSKNRARLKKL